MVTFIDNGASGYSWHGTVRSTASAQNASPHDDFHAYVKKAYCKFYSRPAFNGSCFVHGV